MKKKALIYWIRNIEPNLNMFLIFFFGLFICIVMITWYINTKDLGVELTNTMILKTRLD